jgi:His-Xaa-Ser system protein HxsD
MILKLNKTDYLKEVIEKTILSFESECDLVLEIIDDYYTITSKNNKINKEHFLKELLYNDLRYQIAKRTNTIKKLIIGRALYDTCIRLEQS